MLSPIPSYQGISTRFSGDSSHDSRPAVPHFATDGPAYTPPDRRDSSEGVDRTQTQSLVDDGNVKITREVNWDMSTNPPWMEGHSLSVETGDGADVIRVNNTSDNQLDIQVNGQSYLFDNNTVDGARQSLRIKTNGANDQVTIADDVHNKVMLDGGDGDDTLSAGGSRNASLYGGAGNDTLRLGSGIGYAEGNDGDDVLVGGRGNGVMYGNNGNDRLYSGDGPGSKQSYLDGGTGDDRLYGGRGHTILSGGIGNDQLVGYDQTTFYTGTGRDSIVNNKQGDLIYAQPGDTYDRSKGSTFVEVQPSNAGDKGFTVSGSTRFKQRVADDFETLRSSPSGQKILGDMDAVAGPAGGKVTIRESDKGDRYGFASTELERLTNNGFPYPNRDDPRRGRILDNTPGSRADKGEIQYQPSDIDQPTKHAFGPPIIGLVHEIGHAYNGATGTNLPGRTFTHSVFGNRKPTYVNNTEYQVVGVPGSNAQPFDFDNDPSTAPTTINPTHFTENGMRREMRLPLRRSYLD